MQHTRGPTSPASHGTRLVPSQTRDGRPTAIRMGTLRSGQSMSTLTGGITQWHCPCHNSTPVTPFKERPAEHQTRNAGNSRTQHHNRRRNRRHLPVIHRTEQTQLQIGTQTGISSTDMHRPTRTRLGQILRHIFRNGGRRSLFSPNLYPRRGQITRTPCQFSSRLRRTRDTPPPHRRCIR